MVKCISFDKDGTLIKFDELWHPATISLVNKLVKMYKLTYSEKERLCHNLGVTEESFHTQSVVISETSFELVGVLIQVIKEEFEKLHEIVNHHFLEFTKAHLHLVQPICDLKELFHNLKAEGYKIAVITADNYDVTKLTLEYLDVFDYIDFLATGDTYPKKPQKDAAYQCAADLNIKLSEIIHVGDSHADLLFGRHLLHGIGVLSGNADYHELNKYTEIIINDVQEIYKVLEDLKKI